MCSFWQIERNGNKELNNVSDFYFVIKMKIGYLAIEESSANILHSKMNDGLCVILPSWMIFKFFTAKLILKIASFKLALR